MKSDQDMKNLSGRLNLFFTGLTHILLVAPVIYIIVLYIQKYSFFSWHPILMSVGVGLLIIEGVFCISGEANVANRFSRVNRVTLHWIINSIGLGLMFIGLIIIVVNKNRGSRPHFTTTHGQLGLSSIIISSIVALFGIAAYNTRWFYPKVRPILIKVAHAFGGIAITILFIATIINGIYKESFPGNNIGRSLVVTSFVLALVLVLFKPIIGAVSRTRVLLKPVRQQHSLNT
ncbi:hypothetical protein PV327_006617 [Microctonus hyperodae]|uniref:ascorbate ferrireductase (transmembrane) n=1 Tax=Microctonus hyperodae TaxID=165561 RepID=A0AA39KIH3_MICHY|nr:hypothetical protein PV327_006617 [Microctonus hyperodae]